MRKLIEHYLCHTPRCFRLRTHGNYCALCFIAEVLRDSSLTTGRLPSATVSTEDHVDDGFKDTGTFIPDIALDADSIATNVNTGAVKKSKRDTTKTAVDALRKLKK